MDERAKFQFEIIEDVERGAELSFSGLRVRFADPPSASTSNFVFKRPNFGFRQTDGRTDRRNKHILGLPS